MNQSVILFWLCFLPGFSIAHSKLNYNQVASTKWIARTQRVRDGNGVYLSSDDGLLIVSTKNGILHAFFPQNGTRMWGYNPSIHAWTADNYISCKSGIAFSTTDSLEYMVYSVIINELSQHPETYIIALDMLGQELWISDVLEGVPSGNPVVSLDGTYVFLNHNSFFGSIGHFSIIDGSTGQTVYSQNRTDSPFAPLGIHHAPAEGYYDGGQNNRNDILVWSFRQMPDDISVSPGATFVFQFPIGFNGEMHHVSFSRLGNADRNFRTIARPTFASDGLSLYLATTRSQFRCWTGKAGINRYRFNRPKTASVGFSRGDPPMQAVWAPLAISSVSDQEFYLYGGTASNEFVRLNANFSEELMTVTASLVKTEARVSPDKNYVYYIETAGRLHQARSTDLMDRWIYNFREQVEGDFALSVDGSTIYIADVNGLLHALRVAHNASKFPSEVPSKPPTSLPWEMHSFSVKPVSDYDIDSFDEIVVAGATNNTYQAKHEKKILSSNAHSLSTVRGNYRIVGLLGFIFLLNHL